MKRIHSIRSALSAAVALTLAGASAPALAQGAGEGAYSDRCARCHKVEQVVDYMKAHPEAKARHAWLEGKLARHHARDAAQRTAIIRFLEEEYAKAAR